MLSTPSPPCTLSPTSSAERSLSLAAAAAAASRARLAHSIASSSSSARRRISASILLFSAFISRRLLSLSFRGSWLSKKYPSTLPCLRVSFIWTSNSSQSAGRARRAFAMGGDTSPATALLRAARCSSSCVRFRMDRTFSLSAADAFSSVFSLAWTTLPVCIASNTSSVRLVRTVVTRWLSSFLSISSCLESPRRTVECWTSRDLLTAPRAMARRRSSSSATICAFFCAARDMMAGSEPSTPPDFRSTTSAMPWLWRMASSRGV
mmetsp:Transcript_29562/g.94866  ORF Transcript_29562/g.94866 Transcript_29562/m.94866 type:complete len:264 (-) Transcript_29562:7624-8415(-)